MITGLFRRCSCSLNKLMQGHVEDTQKPVPVCKSDAEPESEPLLGLVTRWETC